VLFVDERHQGIDDRLRVHLFTVRKHEKFELCPTAPQKVVESWPFEYIKFWKLN
jgi:hypothetical protein